MDISQRLESCAVRGPNPKRNIHDESMIAATLSVLLTIDEARAKGWTVVDMKQDWKVIYPPLR